MTTKYPICPDRIRQVPKQFSWVDQRLVRDHYLERCSHQAAALYLFLVTVADCQGLSYYSDSSITRRLSMEESALEQARRNLVRLELIAYRKPLYQVLALPAGPRPICTARVATDLSACNAQADRPLAIGQIFKQIMGGAA